MPDIKGGDSTNPYGGSVYGFSQPPAPSSTEPSLYYPVSNANRPSQPSPGSRYPNIMPVYAPSVTYFGAPTPAAGACYPLGYGPGPAPQIPVQPKGPPPTATNTSSVTTYAVKVKEEYITSPAIPPVQFKQATAQPAAVDLSLEAEILAAESTSGRPTTNSNPSDSSNLLAGMGHPTEAPRPVHIPTVDALDGQLQGMSAAAVNAAEGDEQSLRLALLKCSEHDEKGIVDFCAGMKQVLDVTNGQMGKMDVAMRLVAGEAPVDIIGSHSF